MNSIRPTPTEAALIVRDATNRYPEINEIVNAKNKNEHKAAKIRVTASIGGKNNGGVLAAAGLVDQVSNAISVLQALQPPQSRQR